MADGYAEALRTGWSVGDAVLAHLGRGSLRRSTAVLTRFLLLSIELRGFGRYFSFRHGDGVDKDSERRW